jgi:hypothetical protein
MATALLVGLSREAREAGWAILDWLQSEEIPLTALFWKVDDNGYWTLYLVTPLMENVGSSDLRTRLNVFITTLPEEQREAVDSFIGVISPHRMVVAEVRRRYGTVPPDRAFPRPRAVDPDDVYVYVLR